MLRHSRGLPGLRAGLHRILACCGLALLFSASPSFAQSTAGLNKATQATSTTQTSQPTSVAQQVQLEGELEVLHEDDFKNKKSRTRHFLKTDKGEHYELKFKAHAPHYPSGTKVKVKGTKSGSTLAFASGDSSSVQVLQMATPNISGPQSTLVILANFQDQPTNYSNYETGQPITVASSNALVFGPGLGTVNGFYAENSYGQTTITGTTVGWYTLPMNSTMSTCDTLSIAANAKQAATAAGVNLSAYTRYVYVTPYIPACGFAGAALVGGKESWINGWFNQNTISHELGHNLGLHHSHSLYCSNGSSIGNGVLFPISNNTACTHAEYGDTLDTMGSAPTSYAPHFNAFAKEQLGWLNSAGVPPITTVTTSGTYTIDPYESTGTNPKVLKIFKGLDAYGYKTWYYVEFRQAVGLDSWITSATARINSSNILNGVLVHAYSENNGGNSGYLLDMTQATLERYPQDPALVVGQSFTDAAAGVTINTAWANGTNAGVTVTLSGSSSSSSNCTRANPSVVLSSSQSATVAAGTPVSYTVAVTNNDSSTCGSSTFNLKSVLPSGWSASIASSSLTISPGSATSTTATVTSSTTAIAGSYSVGGSATNSSASTYTATGTSTYSVASSTSTATTTKGNGKKR